MDIELEAFLPAVHEEFGDRPFKAREVLARVPDDRMPDVVRLAARVGDSPVISLGKWMTSRLRKDVGGWMMTKTANHYWVISSD